MIKNKVEQNNKDVEQKRKDLANTEEYKKEIETLQEAKAEQIVRDVMKKRASRRKTAMSAVARAGVSAVADKCVEQTRENIIANYDNAVSIARKAEKALVEQGKDPVNNSQHYKKLSH